MLLNLNILFKDHGPQHNKSIHGGANYFRATYLALQNNGKKKIRGNHLQNNPFKTHAPFNEIQRIPVSLSVMQKGNKIKHFYYALDITFICLRLDSSVQVTVS